MTSMEMKRSLRADSVVMKQFENVAIQCWEHAAESRLGRKPPFICLKAGPEACGVMLMLLDELGGLRPPAQRALTLKPSDRPNAFSRIRFVISHVSDRLTEMSLTCDSETAVFEFTPAGLMRLREAVVLWRNGGEDFSVHPSKCCAGTKDGQSGEVWFWTPFTDP